MNAETLEAIRARRAAITPGKWEAHGNVIAHKDGFFWWQLSDSGVDESHNARFIAHAPDDIRALLAQHDADQQRIAALEAALRELRDGLEHDCHHANRSPEYDYWSIILRGRLAQVDAALKGVDDATP